MASHSAVAIVGCGLIGKKRAKALGDCRLLFCCDIVANRAKELAECYSGAQALTDWRVAATHPEVNIVIIATTHDQLAVIAEVAAGCGKHVLIEKPGARRAAELEPVLREADRTGVQVRVGFNHRYHRALQQSRRIFDSGVLGEMMFIRGRYGHGGRSGYEREWRVDPRISGGGELLDQGVHLIDLARWFLGDFSCVSGQIATYFWRIPVEDNAFLTLKTPAGQTAFLHASWTEWKNTFSLEICGQMGKLEVSGLGGSYGTERLALYQMQPGMGPPDTTIWEYPMADNSWETEFSCFLDDIRLHRNPSPGIRDAQAALRIVEAVYLDASR
jgi:predicted dehydrogenase